METMHDNYASVRMRKRGYGSVVCLCVRLCRLLQLLKDASKSFSLTVVIVSKLPTEHVGLSVVPVSSTQSPVHTIRTVVELILDNLISISILVITIVSDGFVVLLNLSLETDIGWRRGEIPVVRGCRGGESPVTALQANVLTVIAIINTYLIYKVAVYQPCFRASTAHLIQEDRATSLHLA